MDQTMRWQKKVGESLQCMHVCSFCSKVDFDMKVD